jgi:hypothetical protein
MTCWLASGGAKRRAPQHRVLRGHGHKYQTSVPQWERQFRLVRVHDEHREELGRLRLAGIGADAVAVPGQLDTAASYREESKEIFKRIEECAILTEDVRKICETVKT